MLQISDIRRCTAADGVGKAFIGIRKRSRDIRLALSPDSVKTQTYLASTKSATSAAASVIAPPWVRGYAERRIRSRPCSSVESTILAIVWTVIAGYLPTLVSPESITASAPSRMAFATSEVSARVGTGLSVIDEHLGRDDDRCAIRLAFRTMSFCTIGTASRGSSTARSPRATDGVEGAR